MSKEKNNFLSTLGTYAVITFASALYALSFCWFYNPNGISVGGFTGIAQIINYLFPVIPIGVATIALNIPLFILAARVQGSKLLVRSLFCMTACSLFVDIIPKIYTFEPMNDRFLAAVVGGAVVGVAAGLQIRVGATSGGSELGARLLKYKFRHVPVGKLCTMIDVIVIISCALVFGKTESALYGIVSMYVMGLAIDMVVYGTSRAKMAYLISDESEKIRKKLLEMDLGVTTIDSHGGWNETDKQMILCAFRPQQISAIKAAVVEIDPSAFVIVCDAHEVLGEGFHTYSPDDL